MKVGLTLAYFIIFIVAMVGNCVGLHVVCKKSTSRRATELLITNLAIADLILTLTIMPYSLLFVYFEANLWFGGILGNITCKITFYSIPVAIAASVITLTIIFLDRFLAVFYPLKQILFHRQRAITTIIWISSLVSMAPNLFLFQVFEEGGQNFCYQTWPWSDNHEETLLALRIFHAIMFVLLYLVPLLIITMINILIGRRLWFHRSPCSTSSSVGVTPAGRAPRRNVLKMFIVVVIVFALCWFPTYLSHYFMYFQPTIWYKIPILVKSFLFWLSHANSAINPVLYIALNKNFRGAFCEATILLVPFRAVRACIAARSTRVVHGLDPPDHQLPRHENVTLSRVVPAMVNETNKINGQDTVL